MLDVKDLHIAYPGQAAEAVGGVSFALGKGIFGGLVGESGSGKTTTVMALLGLLPEGSRTTGQILFHGTDLLSFEPDTIRRPSESWNALRWKKIAMVPQGAQNSFTPVKTIGSHIEEVLRVHLGIHGEMAHARVAELLEGAELESNIARRYPHELSGGQKQRAAIALALACDPELLLADEPTTALDVITQAEIMKLLQKLRAERHLTILFVTHDLPLAASACDWLYVMKDGLLVEQGEPRRLLTSPEHPYTRRLIDAIL